MLTTDPTRTLPAREDVEGVHVRRVPAWPAKRDYYLAPRIYSEITGGDRDLVHVQSFQTLVAPVAMRLLFARADRLIALAPFEVDEYSRALRLPRAVRGDPERERLATTRACFEHPSRRFP